MRCHPVSAIPPLVLYAALATGPMACSGAVAEPVPWLSVPELVQDEALLGAQHIVSVPVVNSGTAAGRIQASVDPPFSLSDASYAVAAGEQVQVLVFVTLNDAEPVSGTLQLRLGAESWQVPLEVRLVADADGDGFVALSSGGADCDDNDAARYPGAPERCNDLDDDCNDLVDDGLPVIEQWPDADEDGQGDVNAVPVRACGLGTGFVDNADDCDDTDEDAFLGADEVWYDGIDQACDGGSDFDQDGDGADREPEGDDCDDDEPTVYVGAPEVADELDNDCDGARDEDTVVAGELVITETFADPQASSTTWMEVVNPGTTTVDLVWLTLLVDGRASPLPSGWLGPGELLLLCDDDDDSTNGGLGCDGRIDLPDGARTFVLEGPAGLIVDEVDQTRWSLTPGRALELGAGNLDASTNNDEAAWCTGVSLFGDDSGDRGTPGALLPPC